MQLISTEAIRFLFSSFRYSLTLFSKFFSSFPHGTCSLSVSYIYLALDGIYHPLWSTFPSKPTQRKRIVRKPQNQNIQEYNLLCCPVPRDLSKTRLLTTVSIGYNSTRQDAKQIFSLSFSRFTRRYWGNPSQFLFLRLVICLNSAGNFT